VLVAIRDSESRARFLGYRVEHYKLFVFVVSSMLAGVAGALYVPQVGIINPGEFAPINSIEIIIWVAVGGRGTLFGAVIGAMLVNYAKTYFTGAFAELWLFMLGGLFVLTTLYLPKGVVGLWAQLKEKYQQKKHQAEAEDNPPALNTETQSKAAPEQQDKLNFVQGEKV
jgi:urea transport system permease protein